jgi:hypothetical protein
MVYIATWTRDRKGRVVEIRRFNNGRAPYYEVAPEGAAPVVCLDWREIDQVLKEQ